MKDDVYQPPSSKIRHQYTQKGPILKGVLLGVSIDIVVSTVAGILFAAGYYFFLISQGLEEREIYDQIINFEYLSPYGIATFALSFSLAFYAGNLSAKYSGGKPYLSASLVSMVSIVFSVLMSEEEVSVYEDVIVTALNVLAILVGARVWVNKQSSHIEELQDRR